MITTLRKCLRLLGPGQAPRWVVVVVLALLTAGLEVLGALLVVWLLTGITTEASAFDLPVLGDLRQYFPNLTETTVAVLVGVLIASVFVVRAVVIVGQSYVQHRVAENAGARLSARLLQGYLAMPHTFHLQRNSSELVRNAYDTVQHFVRDALIPAVKLFSHSLIVLGLIVTLLVTSPVAALLGLVVIGPLLWVLLRLVHPRVKRLGQTSQVMSRTSLQTLNESLGGWRDIVLLGREDYFQRQFSDDRHSLARARYLRSTARELPRIVLETSLVLMILAYLGLSLLLEGGALQALPTLGLFGYAAVRLQPSLNEVLVAMNSLKFVSPGVDLLTRDIDLFESLARDDAVTGPVQPLELRDGIVVDGVTMRYPGAHDDALRDIDLSVRAGEFIGIVGPTGGGKSTLVDVLLGLAEPARGTVRADGTDIRTVLPHWHASLGVVHQQTFLADTSVRRNIALGVPDEEIDEERIREVVDLAQLSGFVAALPEGLDAVIGEHGVKVSGGQRQRLAIARALYRRPSVIFFDEGTSALDHRTEAQLMDALTAIRGGRTIITVAHRLDTVRACDRVALLDGGRILDVAPFDELVGRHPAYFAAAWK